MNIKWTSEFWTWTVIQFQIYLYGSLCSRKDPSPPLLRQILLDGLEKVVGGDLRSRQDGGAPNVSGGTGESEGNFFIGVGR
jgi:hypothetical protein